MVGAFSLPMICDLSPRQQQALTGAARGLLDREIAGELGLAPQTVRHVLQAARRKLKARNTAHAVAIALTHNLISLEDEHE